MFQAEKKTPFPKVSLKVTKSLRPKHDNVPKWHLCLKKV